MIIASIYPNGVEKSRPNQANINRPANSLCEELKAKCITMIKGGSRLVDISKETGVNRSTLSTWKRELVK